MAADKTVIEPMACRFPIAHMPWISIFRRIGCLHSILIMQYYDTPKVGGKQVITSESPVVKSGSTVLDELRA
jgi:hypothetical protein